MSHQQKSKLYCTEQLFLPSNRKWILGNQHLFSCLKGFKLSYEQPCQEHSECRPSTLCWSCHLNLETNLRVHGMLEVWSIGGYSHFWVFVANMEQSLQDIDLDKLACCLTYQKQCHKLFWHNLTLPITGHTLQSMQSYQSQLFIQVLLLRHKIPETQ